MRYLGDVISQIIRVIPIEDNDYFIDRLKSIRNSHSYASPELQKMWWDNCAETLMGHLPKKISLMNEWQQQIIKIWMNTDDLSEFINEE
jgi:hypothetical protein